MRCANCNRELAKHEHAQPIPIGAWRAWPKSLCDKCAREHQWQPGSAESLQRLTDRDAK